MPLSTTSYTIWCRPEPSSVSPIYIPGRLRTASKPLRTLMESAPYSCGAGAFSAMGTSAYFLCGFITRCCGNVTPLPQYLAVEHRNRYGHQDQQAARDLVNPCQRHWVRHKAARTIHKKRKKRISNQWYKHGD